MPNENLIIRFKIENNNKTGDLDSGIIEDFDLSKIHVVPSIGETVEMNYVNGKKFKMEIVKVDHFLSDIGDVLLQQITVEGKVL